MSAFRNDLVLNDVPYPEDVPGTTKVQNTVILGSRIKNCIIEPSAESYPSVYVNLAGDANIVGSPADLNKTFIITNTMDTSNSHIDDVNVVDYNFDKMTVNIKNFSLTEIPNVKVGDVIYLDVKGFSPLCALNVVFNTGVGIVNKYVPSNPFAQDQLDKLTDNLVDQFTPASMYITSDCTIGLEIVDVSGAGVVYSSIIGTDTFDAFTTYAPASANVVNRPAAAGSTFTGELLTDGVSCLSLVVRGGFVTNIREKFLKFSEFVLNSRQNKGDTPTSRNVVVLNSDGTHTVESIDSLMNSSATFDNVVKLTWTRYGGGGTPTITIGNGVPNAINFNPLVRADAASPPYSLSPFKLGVSNLQITINNVLNESENGPITNDEYIPQFDLFQISRTTVVTPEMKFDGLLKIVNEGSSYIALYANMSGSPATADNRRENVITVGGTGAANYVFDDVAYVGSPDATSTFGSILVVYLKPYSSVVFKIHPMSNDLHSDGDMNLTKLTYMEVVEGIHSISPFPSTYYLHARPVPDPTGFEGVDNEIPPQDSSTGYIIGEVAGTGGFPYKERLLPMNEVLLAGSVSALNPTNGAVCSSNIPAESVLVMGGTSNTNVALRKQYYFKDINTLVGSPPLDPYNLPTGTRIGNAEFNASGLTAARSLTIQDKSGTLAFLSDVQAVKQLGSVITVNNTVLSTEVINIIAPSTAITVLFPATPAVGSTVDIYFVNAATHNITLEAINSKIKGSSGSRRITTNHRYVKFIFLGSAGSSNIGWGIIHDTLVTLNVDIDTKLLISSPNEVGSSVFIDSALGHAITSENAIWTDEATLFGKPTLLRTGGYLRIVDAAALNIAANQPFCIEMYYKNKRNANYVNNLFTRATATDGMTNNLSVFAAWAHSNGYTYGGNSSILGGLSTTLSASNTDWHHFAYTRDASNVIRYFLDGVVVAQKTHSGTASTTDPLIIGSTYNTMPSDSANYLAEIRFTLDSPVYTSNFTPPNAFIPA